MPSLVRAPAPRIAADHNSHPMVVETSARRSIIGRLSSSTCTMAVIAMVCVITSHTGSVNASSWFGMNMCAA